jgi:hypothetical protein
MYIEDTRSKAVSLCRNVDQRKDKKEHAILLFSIHSEQPGMR